MRFLTLFFVLLAGCILTHSGISLQYAAMGLELWFSKMIPALMPFMILSGIMVRMGLTEKVSMIIYPLIRPIFRVRKNVCYGMLMGFLCGFPMGAKVAAELYEREQITRREADYLLAFCNNIGPVYFCSFALPLLKRSLLLPYLFGMYGVPLLYGLFLRRTLYRDMEGISRHTPPVGELCLCGQQQKVSVMERLFAETNNSVSASVQSILQLGGYMILFNLLNLLPHVFLERPFPLLAPLLEITGGLIQIGAALPLYSLLALSFGGLSCIAQTYSCISNTGLSVYTYIVHKVILTVLSCLFYLGWFFLFPASFLC